MEKLAALKNGKRVMMRILDLCLGSLSGASFLMRHITLKIGKARVSHSSSYANIEATP
jgi:hypothetical protein